MNSSQTTIIPKLRVEKSGSKNKDDLRVLIAGVIICSLLFIGQVIFIDFYHTDQSSDEVVEINKESEK